LSKRALLKSKRNENKLLKGTEEKGDKKPPKEEKKEKAKTVGLGG